MMWSEDDVPHRECVACGYSDTLNEQVCQCQGIGYAGQYVGVESTGPKVQAVQFFPSPKLKKD